jgi:hypothetical protein
MVCPKLPKKRRRTEAAALLNWQPGAVGRRKKRSQKSDSVRIAAATGPAFG